MSASCKRLESSFRQGCEDQLNSLNSEPFQTPFQLCTFQMTYTRIFLNRFKFVSNCYNIVRFVTANTSARVTKFVFHNTPTRFWCGPLIHSESNNNKSTQKTQTSPRALHCAPPPDLQWNPSRRKKLMLQLCKLSNIGSKPTCLVSRTIFNHDPTFHLATARASDSVIYCDIACVISLRIIINIIIIVALRWLNTSLFISYKMSLIRALQRRPLVSDNIS